MRPSESTGICACRKPALRIESYAASTPLWPTTSPACAFLYASRLELLRADLAEQAEELAAERALRIAPDVLHRDLEARETRAALLQVVRERGARVRDDDGRREGRVEDELPDAR